MGVSFCFSHRPGYGRRCSATHYLHKIMKGQNGDRIVPGYDVKVSQFGPGRPFQNRRISPNLEHRNVDLDFLKPSRRSAPRNSDFARHPLTGETANPGPDKQTDTQTNKQTNTRETPNQAPYGMSPHARPRSRIKRMTGRSPPPSLGYICLCCC